MLFFLAIILFGQAQAQSASAYINDIDKLYATIKKLPSYKDQIKDDRKIEFEKRYNELRQDTSNLKSDDVVFSRMTRLLFPLKDNHIGYHQSLSLYPNKSNLADGDFIKKYKASDAFINYQRTNLNVDSLRQALTIKLKDDVEGIYYYENYLTVGLFRTAKKDSLIGVVLTTSMPTWEKGQIAMRMYEYGPNKFRAIYSHPLYKMLIYYANEKFARQSLLNSYFYSSVSEMVYSKNPWEINHVDIPTTDPPFQFKTINKNIQYIHLGNFSSYPAEMVKSEDFYNQIRDSLKAPNLIVDMRNNTGGGEKVSGKFLKLLKKYADKGSMYIVINNGTISQGERFVLSLKKLKNITVLGETTQGKIAYGSNSDKTITLPSGKSAIYITDMKDPDNYLDYEDIGINPDVYLATYKDWVPQVVELINKK